MDEPVTPRPGDDEYLSAEGRADRIMALAKELFPEDGYETSEENDGSSLFQLLCEATRLYSEIGYQPVGENTAINVQTTLDAIGENLIEVTA